MPDDHLTPDEQHLLKAYRELKADPDLELPFIENTSAGFTSEGLKVEITLSKSRE